MQGKKASKLRILMSFFKKYKKKRTVGVLLTEDNFIFTRSSKSYSSLRHLAWNKVDVSDRVVEPRLLKTLPHFQYTIKEDFELEIYG